MREIAIFSLLCALAGISYALSYNLQIPILDKIATSLAAIAGSYLLFKIVLDTFVSNQIRDPKAKYSVRKVTSILFAVTLIGIAILIWIEDTQVLLVSYGLIAAGVAIALQDVVKNFVGGIILFSTGMYRVGDRIEIDHRFGDVMDIGLMNTTMLEIRTRYVTDVRERRAIHNQISQRLLDEVLSKPDVMVASATMDISGRHEVHLTGSDRP